MQKTVIPDIEKKRSAGRIVMFLLVGVVLLFVSIALGEPPVRKTDPLQGDPKRSYGAIDVILYQTEWCPYCTKARDFLKDAGVSLVVYDIEKEPDRRAEMLTKSGRTGVPVVDIEGIIIRGYSAEAMRTAIERKRRE